MLHSFWQQQIGGSQLVGYGPKVDHRLILRGPWMCGSAYIWIAANLCYSFILLAFISNCCLSPWCVCTHWLHGQNGNQPNDTDTEVWHRIYYAWFYLLWRERKIINHSTSLLFIIFIKATKYCTFPLSRMLIFKSVTMVQTVGGSIGGQIGIFSILSMHPIILALLIYYCCHGGRKKKKAWEISLFAVTMLCYLIGFKPCTLLAILC